VFTLSGGKDRQPNLENYYLSIDTLRLEIKGKPEAVGHSMEGECHFNLNRDATKFFYVKCDVYNRTKGTIYNFYLDRIAKSEKVNYRCPECGAAHTP
jgi:hypothetical protein